MLYTITPLKTAKIRTVRFIAENTDVLHNQT